MFTFTKETGSGLPLWLPNGATIRYQLEKFIKEEVDQVQFDGADEMWQEFQQLLAETKRVESKITTKEEIAARQQDKEIVERACTYTIESVVKELVDLQLVFDRTIDELTNQLSRESVKLDEVQKAISVETTDGR